MFAEWVDYGEVYTRRWVAETILDLVRYDTNTDLATKTLVEPAVGSGAFLIPAVKRLIQSAVTFGRGIAELETSIRAYDLQLASVSRTRDAIRELLLDAGFSQEDATHLATIWIQVADFLLESSVPKADFVVGNPPYIRFEHIPENRCIEYRRRYTAMRGRADIYVGFFERGLSLLKPEGRLGFICADRWMRNDYGAALRKLISENYSIEAIWSMHDVDAFESEVSAYPAITIISRGRQGDVIVAETTSAFDEVSARELAAASIHRTEPSTSNKAYRAHRARGWFQGSGLWPSGAPSLIGLLEHLNEHFHPLEDPGTGTRISIGVATGADKVYVVRHAEVESDRLLPLAMAADIRGGQFHWGGSYLVNPWTIDGKLVDLATYPRLAAYFEAFPKLRERHVAKKNQEAWYRTIDKVNHSILGKPKLLLQDMRASINPVLEPGGYYPHHNLYYLISDVWDLEVLGGVSF